MKYLKSYKLFESLASDYRNAQDDSQVVDVISTENEIENIVSLNSPIDYIKVIINKK